MKKLFLMGLASMMLTLGATASEAASSKPNRPTSVSASTFFLDNVNLLRSPLERARGAAEAIRLECSQPSEGSGSECSTKHHAQLQWMLMYLEHSSMRDGVDQPTLRSEMLRTPNGEARDAILLARGVLADPEVTQEVMRYLGNIDKPAYLRAAAARALGYLRDPQALPLLTKVLTEDATWESLHKSSYPPGSDPRKSNWKAYPIRHAAAEALRNFQRNLLLPNRLNDCLKDAVLWEEFTDEEWALTERIRAEEARRQADLPGAR